MDKMTSPAEVYSRYKKAQVNIQVCWLAGGYTSEEQYHADLLDNALKAINELKVTSFPEDQTWELQEYGYMVNTIN